MSSIDLKNKFFSNFGLSTLGSGPTYNRPNVVKREFDLFYSLSELIEPKIILEIGSWEGRSALSWGEVAKQHDGMLICVDTWLGSTEHYENALPNGEWQRERIFLEDGYPSIYKTFVTTIRNSGLEEHVIAIPIDSNQAFILLNKSDISPDITYIDASHDYNSVLNDLHGARKIGSKIICGDDYYYFEHGEIKDAVNFFAYQHGMRIQEMQSQFVLTDKSTQNVYDFLKGRGWNEEVST